ncbi:MAG: hypothetical protein J6U25_01910, partial [Clostridia bacterium]|nr:hypothetical protein [Clostridia bacterium]
HAQNGRHQLQHDGKTVAMCCKDGILRILDSVTGDLKDEVTLNARVRCGLYFTADDKFLIIQGDDLTVKIRDIENRTFRNSFDSVYDLSRPVQDRDGFLALSDTQRIYLLKTDDYDELEDGFMLDAKKMASAKPDACVLHPLPRVNEISVDVDDDDRAKYFEQVKNGKYMRMALILFLLDHLGDCDQRVKTRLVDAEGLCCINERCITRSERTYRPMFFKNDCGKLTCLYCESEVFVK